MTIDFLSGIIQKQKGKGVLKSFFGTPFLLFIQNSRGKKEPVLLYIRTCNIPQELFHNGVAGAVGEFSF
ncbi:MAG TPA: hypothetical protein DHV42_00355 [Lachnospiraceae bacterium]|nr:hypothetical protein [Lachnospiraceae bacterium]